MLHWPSAQTPPAFAGAQGWLQPPQCSTSTSVSMHTAPQQSSPVTHGGLAVQPDTVAAQMESAIVFGLTAAVHGEITVKDGRVQQSNFPDYPMVLLADTPQIEVHIVASGIEHLGGVGEPGTPPVAPAVCNALFALTGTRVRSLPIRL